MDITERNSCAVVSSCIAISRIASLSLGVDNFV